ncbi:hypothetical protein [Microcoleus sp. A003_D6]
MSVCGTGILPVSVGGTGILPVSVCGTGILPVLASILDRQETVNYKQQT